MRRGSWEPCRLGEFRTHQSDSDCQQRRTHRETRSNRRPEQGHGVAFHLLFAILTYMLVDRHRTGGQAIFVNFYLLATLFFLTLNFYVLIALANFFFAHFFHNRSWRMIFLLSVAAFIVMPVGMLLNWWQWQQR